MSRKIVITAGMTLFVLTMILPGFALQASALNDDNGFIWTDKTPSAQSVAEYINSNGFVSDTGDEYYAEVDADNPNKVNIIGDNESGHTVFGQRKGTTTFKLPSNTEMVICFNAIGINKVVLKMTYTPIDSTEPVTCKNILKKDWGLYYLYPSGEVLKKSHTLQDEFFFQSSGEITFSFEQKSNSPMTHDISIILKE